jgi:hypothetical protein
MAKNCKVCGAKINLLSAFGDFDLCKKCSIDREKQLVSDRNQQKEAEAKAPAAATTEYSDFAIIAGWVIGGVGLLAAGMNLLAGSYASPGQGVVYFGVAVGCFITGALCFVICTVLGEMGRHLAAIRKQLGKGDD